MYLKTLLVYIKPTLKRSIVFLSLSAFLFQAIVFNAFLFMGVLVAKIEANDMLQNATSLVLNQSQFEKIEWINTNEFTWDGNLYDLKEIKKEGDNTIVICRKDAKEKDAIEKLVEFFKHTKNKKSITFSTIMALNQFTEHYSFLINKVSIFHKAYSSVIPSKASIKKTAPPPKS